jgi:hypothetical protein
MTAVPDRRLGQRIMFGSRRRCGGLYRIFTSVKRCKPEMWPIRQDLIQRPEIAPVGEYSTIPRALRGARSRLTMSGFCGWVGSSSPYSRPSSISYRPMTAKHAPFEGRRSDAVDVHARSVGLTRFIGPVRFGEGQRRTDHESPIHFGRPESHVIHQRPPTTA